MPKSAFAIPLAVFLSCLAGVVVMFLALYVIHIGVSPAKLDEAPIHAMFGHDVCLDILMPITIGLLNLAFISLLAHMQCELLVRRSEHKETFIAQHGTDEFALATLKRQSEGWVVHALVSILMGSVITWVSILAMRHPDMALGPIMLLLKWAVAPVLFGLVVIAAVVFAVFFAVSKLKKSYKRHVGRGFDALPDQVKTGLKARAAALGYAEDDPTGLRLATNIYKKEVARVHAQAAALDSKTPRAKDAPSGRRL